MESCTTQLQAFGIEHELKILSAHRDPAGVMEWATSAASRGIKVIIAAAGGAAHLPGVVAAWTDLPVIGVPVPTEHLGGEDSLFSIVQMPAGIPVAGGPREARPGGPPPPLKSSPHASPAAAHRHDLP